MEPNDKIFKTKHTIFDELSSEDFSTNLVKYQELMAYYKCAILEVETKFKVLNEQLSLKHERNPIESIKTRVKSVDSIIEKLERKGLSPSIYNIETSINDVAGVRVVCSFIDDIYMLAECFSAQDDIDIIRIKDYIKHPKDNGYRSLHMNISIPIFLQQGKRDMKVEVQFRTIAMEFWANLEHRLRYKKSVDPSILAETGDALSRCANDSANLDIEMQLIRNKIEQVE